MLTCIHSQVRDLNPEYDSFEDRVVTDTQWPESSILNIAHINQNVLNSNEFHSTLFSCTFYFSVKLKRQNTQTYDVCVCEGKAV